MKKIIVAGGAIGFLVPALSFAAYLKTGQGVVLGGTEMIAQNAYVAGGNVSVSSPISGDLLAAGANVLVSSKIGQSLMVGGATVNIIGAAAQNLRVIGGNVTVDAALSGELVGAGGQVTVTPNTTIARDSYLAGGTISFGGNEAGTLTLVGGEVRIDGTVGGNVVVRRAQKVTIGAHAVLKKDLEYTAAAPVVLEPGARVLGATTFHQLAAPARNIASGGFLTGLLAFWMLAKLLTVLAVAYLLWYVRRKDSREVLRATRTHFWKELLRGFAFLILVPVASIILLFTVIGIVPAVLALLIYVAMLILAAPLAVLFTASLLKKEYDALAWWHVLLGAVILSVVALIPFLGWLACFVVYLVSLGGLSRSLALRFRDSD